MPVDFDLTSFVSETLSNHKVSIGGNGKSPVIDGKSFNMSTDLHTIQQIFSKELLENPLLLLTITARRQDIIYAITAKAREERDCPEDLSQFSYTDSDKFPYLDTYVLVDASKMRRLILYNYKTLEHEFVNVRYIKDCVELPKQIKPIFKTISEIYSPSLSWGYSSFPNSERHNFPSVTTESIWNDYRPPEYHFLPEADDSCPPLLVRFFKHLIPKPEPRKHVLEWLTTLVSDFEATLPILVLCGKAAIGKNTLVESIMVGLVGIRNFHKAAQLSERFNSSIANCVLHFSDEGEVDGIVKRNLKGFHELYVAIERKGVDVIDPERIYARFVVATNNRRDIKLDYNDRKFSLPELTEKKLLSEFNKEETEWLFNFKFDKDAQKRFYSYLVKNFTPTREAYHGELFKKICYESLPNYFRIFLKLLEEGEEVSFKEYKKKIEFKKMGVDALLNEIEQYEHQVGRKICTHKFEHDNDFFLPIKEVSDE